MYDKQKPSILIIGANRGLGFEWVKHYLANNWDIIATTRNIETSDELKSLLLGKGKIIPLDTTNEESVQSAISQLPEAPTITIYNAGVKGYIKVSDTKATLLNARLNAEEAASRSAGRELAFQVNAYGFDRVMYALKDKLLAKPKASVVYVSTGVADTAQNTDGGYPFYRPSKAAGEDFARDWDIDLLSHCKLDSRPRIFSIVPGLVNTGMGLGIENACDPKKRVEEMAKVITHVINTGDTHGVWKYDGTKYTEFDLPTQIVKCLGMDRETAAQTLAKQGFYKTNKLLNLHKPQTDLATTDMPRAISPEPSS